MPGGNIMLSSQQGAAERKKTKDEMDNVIGDGSGERATGTANTIYDLSSVLFHALEGGASYDTYIDDAEREGDEELAEFSGGSEMRIVSGPTRPKDSWPSAHPPPARRELPRQRWERRRAPPPPWREQRQPASRRRPNPPALRQVWRKSCRPRGRGNFAVGG